MSFHFELQNDMFSLDDFDFEGNNIQDKSSTSNDQISFNAITNQVDQLYGAEDDWPGDFGCSSYGLYQDDDQNSEELLESLLYKNHQQQQQPISENNVVSPSLETCLEEIAKLDHQVIPSSSVIIEDVDHQAKESKESYPFSLASLELLNSYENRGFKRLKGERIVKCGGSDDSTPLLDDKLSTEEILRVAGARFVINSALPNGGLTFEETTTTNNNRDDVELVEILLSCAEKVGFQQHESAARLLNLCGKSASKTGSPVQRVVYYFCEALRERIDRETGRFTTKQITVDIDRTIMGPDVAKLALQKHIPLFMAEKLAGVQAIIENASSRAKKKLHIIDLRIGFGLQWTSLIQFLASQENRDIFPVELLKITALATRVSKHEVEETGKRLSNFACSMDVPFCFTAASLEEEYSFKADPAGEMIAVYSSYSLSPLISVPTKLERLMRVIRGLRPRIMVVAEIEARQNSRSFFARFVETLFYQGALFDCLEASMRRGDTNRAVFESLYCGGAVRNVVAAEGEERKVRNVSVEVWRAFFARFGMEEIEMSKSSLEEAKLVANKFEFGGNCTFEMNGNCLMIGWKGTPLHSLSAWRFL